MSGISITLYVIGSIIFSIGLLGFYVSLRSEKNFFRNFFKKENVYEQKQVGKIADTVKDQVIYFITELKELVERIKKDAISISYLEDYVKVEKASEIKSKYRIEIDNLLNEYQGIDYDIYLDNSEAIILNNAINALKKDSILVLHKNQKIIDLLNIKEV